MWIDSHCHLTSLSLRDNLSDIISRMQAAAVSQAMIISTTRQDWLDVQAVKKQFPSFNFKTSLGLHPEDVLDFEPTVQELVGAAKTLLVNAIGETGLDYFHQSVPKQIQHDRFRTHIRAAKQLKLPLIIHTREAAEDTLRILKEEQAADVGGVFHCFTESYEVATQAIDLNFKISFSGILTFKNAKDLQEVAFKLPLDHLMVETDSPYLAPVPKRGKLNEPTFVQFVGEYLAQLKNTSIEECARVTSQNYLTCFVR
jgi:TatD DNase family protein